MAALVLNADAKRASAQAALDRIGKQHGPGAAMFGTDAAQVDVETFSSGSLAVDQALGVNGYPKGRVIEIFGPEASGKTTLALHAVASVQADGGLVGFIDAEHAIDPEYARNLGVNFDDLIISQPSSGEQALMIVDELVRSGALDLIVIDSVAALAPKAEIDGDMGDSHVGLQARLMGQALRKLTANLNDSNTTLIFINQLRQKIGTMGYGPSETTPGGKALPFYASVRVDVRRIETLKQGDNPIGSKTKVRIVKNKVAPPFKIAVVEIYYGVGVCPYGELLTLGKAHKLVKLSGSWLSFDGEQLGQGSEKAREALRADPVLCAKLRAAVLTAMGRDVPADEPAGVGTPARPDIDAGSTVPDGVTLVGATAMSLP